MTDRITIPLRLDPKLHARLKKLAEADQRSLNAFIVLALSRLAGGLVAVVAEVPLANPYVSGAKVRKVGPNELCPCGSGTKYKRCHGR